MTIHPTAIVSPEAELGAGVEIGPFVVIEGAARLGDRCIVQAHAVITGHVTMGADNTIGYGAIIGGDPQDTAFRPSVRSAVVLGDRNRIREHCTIHRGTGEGTATTVGSDCFLMAGAHLAHNVELGDGGVLANNVLVGGHVKIADRVFIGGGCVFHQFVRVGRLVIAQGASGFGKDIPPFTMAAEKNGVAGLNTVGLRRAGFSLEQRGEAKEAFRLLYRSGLNVSQALESAGCRAWSPAIEPFWEFVRTATKRGLCDYLSTRRTVATPAAEVPGE